jgi:hypothetical protein
MKLEYTLGNFLSKMKPNTDTLDRSQCIYRIPCECGGEYIGDTSRPLNVMIREHKCNLGEGHFDKSKLASHAVEKGHTINWTNTTMLHFEANSIHRKYKETARILCSNNSVSQPC